MAWYPVMNGSDGTDFFTITSYANTVSKGILMPAILLIIFTVSLAGTTYTGRSFWRGLIFSGFLCSILSVMLVIMNLLNPNYMYLAFILTGFGVVGTLLSEAFS